MKKRLLIFIIATLSAIALFGGGYAFGAGSAQPGSQGDPLVTLSYLESRLADISGDNSQITGNGGVISNNGTSAGFSRIDLLKGQSLILSDGSEMVVYSGNGTVLGTTGMMNLAEAQMFPAGTSVVLYTQFMGIGGTSGVKAGGNMTIYVRGGYKIEQ